MSKTQSRKLDAALIESADALQRLWAVTKTEWTPENVARWEAANAAHTKLWEERHPDLAI